VGHPRNRAKGLLDLLISIRSCLRGGQRLRAGADRMLAIMHTLDGALATVAPGG
jgi:hypothetical protein